jgi:S-DNA-T family DNA segregation ATPase FtsK/SpoIIIE
VWSRKNVEAGYGENDWCIARNGQQGHARSGSERLYRYEDDLLVIPGLSMACMARTTTAPSPLPEKIGNLLQESRWLGVGAVALFLIMALWGFNREEDPGWSHAVVSSTLHNPTGRAGAWIADLLLYLFGLSAWWWIVLLACSSGGVSANSMRRTSIGSIRCSLPWADFHCCCWPVRRSKPCVFIRSRRIAAGAGRPARHRTGRLLATQLGYTGSTLFLLAVMAPAGAFFPACPGCGPSRSWVSCWKRGRLLLRSG